MNLAKIENGNVVQIAVFDPNNIPEFASDWVDATELTIGMIDDGNGNFIAPSSPDNDLDNAKQLKNKQINDLRLERLNDSELIITHNSVVYQADPASRTNINGLLTLISAGGTLPPGFVYRAADNVDYPLSEADLLAVGALMVGVVNEIYQISWNLKAQIDAATTIEEVIGVVWPE